jgi:peptide-methionine (S)-S-oxide reductase
LHAETVQIFYDSTKVSYEELLNAFFGSHDPSTLNRQGPDYGPQYRSIIFYQNELEKNAAKRNVEKLLSEKIFDEIMTQIIPLDVFYKAEIYHQDYEKRNPNNSYIQLVSKPRLDSFKAKYEGLLKKEQH